MGKVTECPNFLKVGMYFELSMNIVSLVSLSLVSFHLYVIVTGLAHDTIESETSESESDDTIKTKGYQRE